MNLQIDGLDLDEKNEFFYVSGSNKHILKFSFGDFKEVGLLKGNNDISYRVRISKDQNWLYSISCDSTVRAWDLNNFGQSKILYTHSGPCNSLDLSFDGEFLITCGHDAKIKIYCIPKETLVIKIPLGNRLSWCVKFSKNKTFIGSGGDDGNLYIWKYNDWGNKKTFSGHLRTIPYFTFTDDEKYCVSSGHDNIIKIWDIESSVLRISLTGHSNSITKVLITEDKQILSAGNDGNLFIWPFPLIKDCTKWIFSYNNSVFCIGNGGINEFDLLKMTHLRGLKFIFECV